MTDTTTFNVSVYDVWSDGEGGWTGNYMVHQRIALVVPTDLSDRAVENRARKIANFTGRKTIRDCDGCFTRWVDPAAGMAMDLDWGH